MARAKNTSRAEARKRTRDEQRAFLAAEGEDLEDSFDDTATDEPAPRPRLFQMPNIAEDIRALPEMFRTKRSLWIPFGLVLLGFLLALVIYGMPAEVQGWILLYLQFFFVPQGLFVYFIAGFLAPRASYLVGLLTGLASGVLYAIAILATEPVGIDAATQAGIQGDALRSVIYGPILGAFAGGFAAWYRNFLRNMQANSNQRRAQKEVDARAKRREARQQTRNVFKRPGS